VGHKGGCTFHNTCQQKKGWSQNLSQDRPASLEEKVAVLDYNF